VVPLRTGLELTIPHFRRQVLERGGEARSLFDKTAAPRER